MSEAEERFVLDHTGDEVNHGIDLAHDHLNKSALDQVPNDHVARQAALDSRVVKNTSDIQNAVTRISVLENSSSLVVSSINGKTGIVVLTASEVNMSSGNSVENTIESLKGSVSNSYTKEQVNSLIPDVSQFLTTVQVAQIMDDLLTGYALKTELQSHINGDDARWAATNKAIVDLRAELKQFAIDTYAGTTPTYDYSRSETIMQAGGLVNLADQGTYTIPVNGAIQAQVGGLLGAGLQVQVNGTTVWTAPLSLLVPLNSPEIQVNAGDQIGYTGVVGLGQSIEVTFFPNKI